MTTLLLMLTIRIRAGLAELRDNPEAGYSTETVIITAVLSALALLVVGTVIYNKVVAKAGGISLG